MSIFIKLSSVPFDDDKAKYDSNEHKYVPTLEYILKKTGIDMEEELGDINDAEAEVLGIVDHAYEILYDTANSKDRREYRKIKEYRAAKDLEIRDDLINYLVLSVRASINTDIDRVGDEHGINYETGTRIEKKKWDDLPTAAKRKAKATELMYEGRYNYRVDPDDFRKDY